MSAPPGRILCIGTHHKTGTVWMRRLWREIARRHGVPYLRLSPFLADPPRGPAIVVDWHSRFPRALLDRPEVRALHLIRDPRDVLLSGLRHHLSGPAHGEKWLTRPRASLGGLSYRAHLRALPGPEQRLLFEMEHKHKATLEEMLRWPEGTQGTLTLRYEALIGDTEGAHFRASLAWLSLPWLSLEDAGATFWDYSIFGGMASARPARLAGHVVSGAGEQWRQALPRAVALRYAMRFGPALARLGYADGAGWAELCPLAPVGQAGKYPTSPPAAAAPERASNA